MRNPAIDQRPAGEFCGFCGHHMDPHDYSGTNGEVPCSDCPDGICPRKTGHFIADGSATTSCCGKTPGELPYAKHTLTGDPWAVTCQVKESETATRPHEGGGQRG